MFLSDFSSALNKGINIDANAASVDINFVISSTGSSTAIIFLTSSSWWVVNMLMEVHLVAYAANAIFVYIDCNMESVEFHLVGSSCTNLCLSR